MQNTFGDLLQKASEMWNKERSFAVGILCFLSGIIGIICGVYLYVFNIQIKSNSLDTQLKSFQSHVAAAPIATASSVVVYVSGAVKHPGLYELDTDSRIFHAMEKAGGLTSDADSDYIQKELNLAEKVKANQKIYFQPYQREDDNQNLNIVKKGSPNNLISINSASAESLNSLPGIGEKLAEKIISHRPYETIEELRTKAQIGVSVFEGIKKLIEL